MTWELRMTSQFKKDLRLAKKQKTEKDLDLLFSTIKRILNQEKLIDLKQHKLMGSYDGFYECHLKPDWLLVWKVFEEEKII